MNSNATRARGLGLAAWSWCRRPTDACAVPTPNRSRQLAAERVPVGDREPQMVLHRLAGDEFVGVVMLEGERVLGVGAFVLDLFDVWECSFHSFLQFQIHWFGRI